MDIELPEDIIYPRLRDYLKYEMQDLLRRYRFFIYHITLEESYTSRVNFEKIFRTGEALMCQMNKFEEFIQAITSTERRGAVDPSVRMLAEGSDVPYAESLNYHTANDRRGALEDIYCHVYDSALSIFNFKRGLG